MSDPDAGEDVTAEPRTGTQSIERAVAVLRAIASRGRLGMRIAEVVTTAGLPQSTCSRMLQCLEREGLVDKEQHTRKYFLGPLVSELGLVARPRYRLSELCDASLRELAQTTQDTVYLSERSGLEAVCTARVLGDYPIKALPLDVGIRRPLGVGAGGLAILAAMEPDETAAVVRTIGSHYEGHGRLTVESMLVAVAETRARGYSFVESTVTPGTSAVGVAVPGEVAIAAISVSAINGRLGPERRQEVARLIQRHAAKFAAVLQGMRGLT